MLWYINFILNYYTWRNEYERNVHFLLVLQSNFYLMISADYTVEIESGPFFWSFFFLNEIIVISKRTLWNCFHVFYRNEEFPSSLLLRSIQNTQVWISERFVEKKSELALVSSFSNILIKLNDILIECHLNIRTTSNSCEDRFFYDLHDNLEIWENDEKGKNTKNKKETK